ncbi:hypothetical protein R3P38DRAFT_2628879 [Favolaschia claudopus]|uniref:F-box domain-containing protein n=1 Tax=Favolaschia claudopus TaxID=2862362 RepID=A0AAW0B9Q6_9AGAR
MSSAAAFVAGLREHIHELTDTIRFQEHLLCDLKEEQRRARKQLNSFVDPMARLPVELLSEIFTLCVSGISRSRINCCEAPMSLLQVCQSWRDVALAIPNLWTRLEVEGLPCSDEFVDMCTAWVGRAKGKPLALSLSGVLNISRNVRQLLDVCGQQLHELSLELQDQGLLDRRIDLQGATFPSLRTLILTSASRTPICTPKDSVELLRAAPALLECHFRGMRYSRIGFGEGYISPLTHTYLTTLHLGQPEDADAEISKNSAVVLKYLTLPALRDLLVTELDISESEAISFFTRSSPPLYRLELIIKEHTASMNWGPGTLAQCLQVIPTLRELRVSGPGCASALLVLMINERILPNLRHVTVWPSSPQRADYALVLALLSSRSTLESFKFILDNSWPHDEDVFALRELADSRGIDIHVGPFGINYIDLSRCKNAG